MEIKIKRLTETAVIPRYQTSGSAGMDIHADLINRSIAYKDAKDEWYLYIRAGQTIVIPSGFSLELPEDLEAQIRSRSGLALKHGIIVPNSPGTIDSDYRGEVGAIIKNTSDKDFLVMHGDRIAQMVVCPIIKVRLIETSELDNTQRGSGGFGSTGSAGCG